MRLSHALFFAAVPSAWALAIRSNSSGPVAEPDLNQLQFIPDNQKPRIFVMTDILNEPDDQQSVVRYLLYSNEFDTRALCAVTSNWLRDSPHPEAIERIVNAYGEVVDNLNKHVHPMNQYAPVDKMLSLITSGPSAYGKEALDKPISEGASRLVKSLQESSEPLWVLIWGGANTLAQSLHYMQANLTESEFAILRSRIRVYSISDQDDAGEWIRNSWPDIFYIASVHAFSNYALATWRGMWEGLPHLSVDKVSQPWVQKFIEMGPLGDVYPTRDVGVEGDTPSFLYLIQNGLGDRENPTYGSWGGRWGPTNIGGRHYSDTLELFFLKDGESDLSAQASVARWRDHFQNDMATRMQWSISADFSNGTHPPVPRINGTTGPAPVRFSVTPGSEVTLDASMSFDPDHAVDSSLLDFEWFQYQQADYLVRASPPEEFVLRLEGKGAGTSTPDVEEPNDSGFLGYVKGDQVRVSVPDQKAPYEYHLILQVTSNNYPELPVRRYLRVLMLASNDSTDPSTCCEVMEIPMPKPTDWN